MKYPVSIISLITFLLSSCNFAFNFSTTIPTSTPTKLEITSKIYSAALSYGAAMDGGGPPVQYCSSNNLALYYMTKNAEFDKEDWGRIHQLMPAIEKELWDNFLQINLQPIPLPENLYIGCKYRLVTRSYLKNGRLRLKPGMGASQWNSQTNNGRSLNLYFLSQ